MLIILIILHKTQLQTNKDINTQPNALNMIEENVYNNLELTGTRKGFLNRTSKVQTIHKCYVMKLNTIYKWQSTLSFKYCGNLQNWKRLLLKD